MKPKYSVLGKKRNTYYLIMFFFFKSITSESYMPNQTVDSENIKYMKMFPPGCYT